MGNTVDSGQVMVSNDQIDAGAARSFSGGEGADAGVHADNQPHAVGRSALDHLVAHAIAFADAVWDMEVSRSAAKLDGRLENHDRRGAVDVVVAVNQNFLFALQSCFQAIQGS